MVGTRMQGAIGRLCGLWFGALSRCQGSRPLESAVDGCENRAKIGNEEKRVGEVPTRLIYSGTFPRQPAK